MKVKFFKRAGFRHGVLNGARILAAGMLALMSTGSVGHASDTGQIALTSQSSCFEARQAGDDSPVGEVVLQECNAVESQSFSFQPVEGGKFQIVSGVTGFCLAVGDQSNGKASEAGKEDDAATTKEEYQLLMQACDGSEAQQFDLKHFVPADYSIVSGVRELCISARNLEARGIFSLKVATCNGAGEQKFSIIPKVTG